jgi:DNA-binding IclR family transcriptional regulator
MDDHSQVPRRSGTQRVLAILAAFSAERPALTLSEISRAAELSLTTAHRQLAELTNWGALERDDDGRYRIGLRLWGVASLARPSLELRDAALPFMQDLYEATHENVQLAVADGDEVMYVERISGRHAVHIVTRPGSRLPMHATGVGLVLLAHAPFDQVERVLAGPLRRYTDHTITDPARLRLVLGDARRDGYVISDRQIELVSVSIAVPIWGRHNAVVAALSVVISAKRAQARRLVPAVRTAALGISRVLGAR